LFELPLTTLQVAGRKVPACGGGYFRMLPYGLTRAAFDACERRGVPGVFYVHPWEVDPGQPRFAVPWAARLRHYSGLRRTLPRLSRLLSTHRFTAIAAALPAGVPAAP
jgi:hypothetical protein